MFSGLKIPANALTLIKFMIKLATFDLVPTEIIDEQIYYWPENDGPFSVNFEMTGTESVILLANIGFTIYMIYLNVFAILVHACLHPCRNSLGLIQRMH